jgi:hypothetical protein
MAKISKDLTIGNLHPRENFYNVTPATFGAVNAEQIIDAHGTSTITIDLRGTFSQTIELSGTVDGTNWTPIPVRAINQASVQYNATITGTTAGVWVAKNTGYVKVRARCTAYTSGSALVILMTSNTILDDSLQGQITPQVQTITAAISTAATLTIASPGVGLRHYITSIKIQRFAGALLTAAATPVVITTTNLPGALAFSLPADAAAQGTIYDHQYDINQPIASSAQNTATTIVAPLTTGVIWRITAGYYVAP